MPLLNRLILIWKELLHILDMTLIIINHKKGMKLFFWVPVFSFSTKYFRTRFIFRTLVFYISIYTSVLWKFIWTVVCFKVYFRADVRMKCLVHYCLQCRCLQCSRSIKNTCRIVDLHIIFSVSILEFILSSLNFSSHLEKLKAVALWDLRTWEINVKCADNWDIVARIFATHRGKNSRAN